MATHWQTRFGSDFLAEEARLDEFLAHRSVRHYADTPISEELLANLIGCAQSAATSSNLQLWTVISVDEPSRRAEIAALCANQVHVAQAPRFLAFCADLNRIQQAAKLHGIHAQGVNTMEFFLMATIDAALAAERLVCAAEAIGLGICYIGGLRNHPEEVAQLLDLPEGVAGVFGLCLGYPDPTHPAQVKPRLSPSAVWHRERYNHSPDLAEYDVRMNAFYNQEGMGGDHAWTKRSAIRSDGSPRSMTGREVWMQWLRSRGLAQR